MNTYTYILTYVRRHAQHEHSISHTYIIHTYIAHTHINSLTHTHTTHIHHLHKKNSPTIAFPSLSYFLFPCSLTHSLTHSHSHSLTCACAYIHTYTKTHPPSPLHHSYTSSSLLAFLLSLSLEKLVTCGVIRSYNLWCPAALAWHDVAKLASPLALVQREMT